MIYVLLVLLLLFLIYFVGNFALLVSTWMGLTLIETKMVVTGYGVSVFIALVVWALLDKSRKHGS